MDKRTLSIPVVVLTIVAAIATLGTAIFLILSNPSTPTGSVGKTEASSQTMVEKAKEDLAKNLSLSINTIKVTGVTKKEWGDASLGCPKGDMAYIQVVTPGYQMILEANGKTYDYRSDLERRVELCTK